MFKGCPNGEAKADLMVCVCFLRTQQCAKSQCIKRCTTPVGIGFRIGSAEIISEEIAHGWVAGFQASFGGFWCQSFNGEFDPGSGRTLAACLTHASRAERPFGVLERRTGEQDVSNLPWALG